MTHSKEGKDVRGSVVHTQVSHSLLRDVRRGATNVRSVENVRCMHEK